MKTIRKCKDHKAILDLFASRINLYKKCAEQTEDPLERGIIEAKKMVIMGKMGLMAAQYEMQTELAKINSRLDSLGISSPNQKTWWLTCHFHF